MDNARDVCRAVWWCVLVVFIISVVCMIGGTDGLPDHIPTDLS